jgi:hypothetical protein
MSGRDRGKKLFADLAEKARAQIAPSGEPVLHARGQKAVADLAADLSGPESPPGLKVFRDGGDRFRLQRPGRNGEIAVRWNRPIGAIVVMTARGDRVDPEIKYLYRDTEEEWTRMEGEGELYEDISKWLVEYLYPELKNK